MESLRESDLNSDNIFSLVLLYVHCLKIFLQSTGQINPFLVLRGLIIIIFFAVKNKTVGKFVFYSMLHILKNPNVTSYKLENNVSLPSLIKMSTKM